MFGSTVLEVAIGLVLVYLLISIVLTSVSEAIEALLKTRATDLENALSQLFQGDTELLTQFYRHPLVSGLYRGDYTALPTDGPARARGDRINLPSYIPRETFATAVMEIVGGSGCAKMKTAVKALAARTGVADVAGTRRDIEAWYDGAMDRASGWFKRRTQGRLFVLGLLIALVGNVNSVTIGQYLAINQEAREAVVELAEQTRTTMPPPTADPPGNEVAANEVATENAEAANASTVSDETGEAAENAAAEAPAENVSATDDAVDGNASTTNAAQPAGDAGARRQEQARADLARLRAIGLPIGWSDPVLELTVAGFPPRRSDNSPSGEENSGFYHVRWVLAVLILLAGYLATAFAVMLGAPFWFDLLNKLMVVRSTVKPREKSPDEPAVDGPAPPNR